VFDLTRLRGRNAITYYVPDAVNKDFGQAHNIVANEEKNFLYVVGARDRAYPLVCAGTSRSNDHDYLRNVRNLIITFILLGI